MKTAAIVLAAALLTAAITLGLCFLIGGTESDTDRARDKCQALNAQPVETAAGHFICIDQDGRIVGPVAK